MIHGTQIEGPVVTRLLREGLKLTSDVTSENIVRAANKEIPLTSA